MVTALSLVSGIGGIELGLRLAIPGLRVLGYVERESYSASVLLARMEDETLEPAPIFCGNMEDFDARPFAGVDLVTAGLPCQPFSVAGKQLGHEGERAIWPEFIRIVGECRPAVVFLENVPAFVTGGWFRRPGEELSRLGYRIERPLFLAAEDVGATHKRERVFILAYTTSKNARQSGKGSKAREKSCGRSALLAHTSSARTFRTRQPESNRPSMAIGSSEQVANPMCQRRQQKPERAFSHEAADEGRATQHDHELAGHVKDVGHAEQLDGRQGQAQSVAIQPPYAWPPGPSDWQRWAKVEEALEPAIRIVADGIPDWMEFARYPTEQLRCLGNAVMPVVAATAFRILAEEAGICMSS